MTVSTSDKVRITDKAQAEKAAQKNRMIEFAVYYLKEKDYAICDKQWECEHGTIDLVAESKSGDLLFVNVEGSEEEMPEGTMLLNRGMFERIAACYLMAHSSRPSGKLDFQELCINMFEGKQAMLRHERGVLAVA